MRSILFLGAVFISFQLSAQPTNAQLQTLKTNSWYKACYRVPADSAFIWLKKNEINFSYLEKLEPVSILPDSISTDSAKNKLGQYIWVKTNYEKLTAHWEQISKLSCTIINDGLQKKLLLYNLNGQIVSDAKVLVDGKTASFSATANAYILPHKKWKEDEDYWVKIATPTDTFFCTAAIGEKNNRYNNYYNKNKWKTFPVIKQALVISHFFKRLFGKKNNYYHNNILRKKQKETGFVLFNKPVYKPGDTVKLKAWITDRKQNPIDKPQSLWISYQANGAQKSFELSKLSAASVGSFPYQFALPDSFPNDTHYQLDFRGPKKFNHLAANFKMEEYQLPDISKFDFAVDKHETLQKDTLTFTLNANGTNGLPLLDASVQLIVLAGNVSHFYKDSLFIPDTLFQRNYPLQTDGKTTVKLPADIFPAADMELKTIAILKNSSNETTEKSELVNLYFHRRKINFNRKQNVLYISYTEDGISIAHNALINISNDLMDIDTLLRLPANIVMHPLATDYDIKVYDELGKKLLNASYDYAKDNQKPTHNIDCRGESIGFVCNNPNKITIDYTVTKGKKIIWQHQHNDAQFSWYKKVGIRHLYHLHISYLLAGEQKNEELRLGVFFKKLDVQVAQQPVVQPGGKDTLHIAVTDYKNHPVSNANLTASGQNTQLQKNFNFPNLPYQMNFKDRHKNINAETIKMDDPILSDDTTAAHFPITYKRIGLDTMLFYQLMFSKKLLTVQRSVIAHVFPEIGVKAMSHGKPEAIYITYLNRKIYSCAWQNAGQPHSTEMYPGYVQIGIRTKHKYVQIDSIYLQPYYKHDVFINIDSLANQRNVVSYDLPDTLSNNEKDLLGQRFIRMERNAVSHSDAWIWQGSVAAHLSYSNEYLIAGPFNAYDSINTYRKNSYQFKFPFEPGYTYQLTKNLTRMEKTGLLPGKISLRQQLAFWHIGDTIPNLELPPVETISPKRKIYLRSTYANYHTNKGNGTLQLQVVSDSSFRYLVLMPYDTTLPYVVADGNVRMLHNLPLGKYRLVLVCNNDSVYSFNQVFIKRNGLSCYEIHPENYFEYNADIDSILLRQMLPIIPAKEKEVIPLKKEIGEIPLMIPYGKSNISGKVFDINGGAIPGASVVIKGTNKGVSTNLNGMFQLPNLAAGNYVVRVNCIGYESKEVKITTIENETTTINIGLKVSSNQLNDVVVVGYGSVSKRELTGSVVNISSSNFNQSLQGRVAGLSVDGEPGAGVNIRIRGAGNLNENNKPLYVVDGVLMDEMPANMDTSILKIEILKDAMATSLYGSRAANGVVIISTGRNNGPAIRTKFKDDAYWEPNVVTDKNGHADIAIQYPENITNWQNILYAAAPKGFYGQAFAVTKAFKSVQGLLTVPAFLITGDSVQLVGKAMNFSANPQGLSSNFKMGNINLQSNTSLSSNSSSTQMLGIKATEKTDTLKASFAVQDAKGNTDGEERTIPVFEKGTMETKGQFFVLDGDTTVTFKPAFDNVPITWHAENKLIDVLENELENLRNYPQACLEQTANKVWGLLMMKQIKIAKHQPFMYEGMVGKLIDRLMQNQKLDGGWPWWPGGGSNLYITTKVLQALRQIPATETIKQSIRNGFIYLQNQLPKSKQTKLEILAALAEGNHIYPYQFALDSLHFDSLTVHQQWQWIRIKQKTGLDYALELNKILKKQQQTVTGGTYWGNENWYWQSNRNASTVLAFRVLGDDSLHNNYLPHLKQYFLEQRSIGHYRNTVEQAEISALLLTSALQKSNDTAATILTVDGADSKEFPANKKIAFQKEITIRKKGSGLIYFGASQQQQNRDPQKVDSLFDVKCSFIAKNGDTVQGKSIHLPLAAPIFMQIKIKVKKEAQFVQIEIPIPAGMVYASKPQDSYYEHREYLKDKVLIFKEQLSPGEYTFSVPLETRFTGQFSLNPAKVQLMYFPMFFGREGMKEVGIW